MTEWKAFSFSWIVLAPIVVRLTDRELEHGLNLVWRSVGAHNIVLGGVRNTDAGCWVGFTEI